jgi:hypothetical protein
MVDERVRLAAILEALDALYHPTRHGMGGYPAEIDASTIPGYVVVASVSWEGYKPALDIYPLAQLHAWYDEAVRTLPGEYGFDDLVEALVECEIPTGGLMCRLINDYPLIWRRCDDRPHWLTLPRGLPMAWLRTLTDRELRLLDWSGLRSKKLQEVLYQRGLWGED